MPSSYQPHISPPRRHGSRPAICTRDVTKAFATGSLSRMASAASRSLGSRTREVVCVNTCGASHTGVGWSPHCTWRGWGVPPARSAVTSGAITGAGRWVAEARFRARWRGTPGPQGEASWCPVSTPVVPGVAAGRLREVPCFTSWSVCWTVRRASPSWLSPCSPARSASGGPCAGARHDSRVCRCSPRTPRLSRLAVPAGAAGAGPAAVGRGPARGDRAAPRREPARPAVWAGDGVRREAACGLPARVDVERPRSVYDRTPTGLDPPGPAAYPISPPPRPTARRR